MAKDCQDGITSEKAWRSRRNGAGEAAPDAAEGEFGTGTASNAQRFLKVNKAINRRLTEAASSGGIFALLDIVKRELMRMNGVNMATALHRVARMSAEANEASDRSGEATAETIEASRQRIVEHPSFQALLAAIEERAHAVHKQTLHKKGEAFDELDDEVFPAQCASIVAWSCATLRLCQQSLLYVLSEVAGQRLDRFKPYEVTNMLWAYAKLAIPCPNIFRKTSERLAKRLPGEFKAQCLSLAAWSFATARWRDPQLFQSLAGELVMLALELKPQEISNTLWAFAKSRFPHVALFDALGDAAASGHNIWRFKPQELSNTVWAFATVGLRHENLFSKASAVVVRRSRELIPQNVANILWAYCKLQSPDCLELFPKLLDVAAERLSTYKPQEIAAVALAAAQSCPHYTRFFDVAYRSCCTRLREFPSRTRQDLVEAFALVSEANRMMPFEDPHKYLFQDYTASATSSHGHGTKGPAGQARTHTSTSTAVGGDSDSQESGHEEGENEAAAASAAHPPMLAGSATAGIRHGLGQPIWGTSSSMSNQPSSGLLDFDMGPICQQGGSLFGQGNEFEFMEPGFWPPHENFHDPCAEYTEPLKVHISSSMTGAASSMRSSASSTVSSAIASEASWYGRHPQLPRSPPPVPASQILMTDCVIHTSSKLPRPLLPQSALAEEVEGPDLILQPLAPGCLKDKAGPLRLRHGALDLRVHLRRVIPGGVDLSDAIPSKRLPSQILVPVAFVMPTGQEEDEGIYLAYPYCEKGSVAEWLAAHRMAGWPVSSVQAARVAMSVLSAVEALLAEGSCPAQAVIGAIQPDDIFLDINDTAKVRAPLPAGCIPQSWSSASQSLKWQSPEEANGKHIEVDECWPSISFRLGLLLYCLGCQDGSADPYPKCTPDAVLSALMREDRGMGPPLRPDFQAFRGSSLLSHLTATCLRIGTTGAPDKAAVGRALEALAAGHSSYVAIR